MTQREKAERLRALHHGAAPLLLCNAWDAASAKILEELGFAAVATSSGAMANSLGFPDGERIGRERMLEAVSRIAHAVELPVTADLEAGYGPTVRDAELTARGAIASGAVGLNFEDGMRGEACALIDADLQAERIHAIRSTGEALGVPLVINARIDTYLNVDASDEQRERETIARAKRYLAAGADCIFPVMLKDAEVIARLVRAIDAPVNILAIPGAPSIAQLDRLGVKRVSFGSLPMRHAMNAFRSAAQSVLAKGDFRFG